MNQTARRIGRSLALVLPVVLVLSGTLAVSSVPWAGQRSETQLLTAAAENVAAPAAARTEQRRAPQDLLLDRLVGEMERTDPGVALTHLQRAVEDSPSLAPHCMSIARDLGAAAVRVYGPTRAQSFSRPVCDTSFAGGVAAAS
ncbi:MULTISPECIES: hypothetical protein [Streptomyces]|uniref:Uncharacterized protein n=2 Tax=Streptomyces TaxID=1883 RepID=A0A1D8G2F5_9ACTN|nr:MULTISPECIES: hypothetical protein [Streptomyces]AOT59623.1 hypothetical protein A4G23_02466 [Streptomyces rubrolavendulae]KAF0651105.1 membrane protein [Streptomyces fradiae ATCC 10745 = DSM 40063]OSY53167.1 hypothetical protein BG846_01162 [Streptomyces fradiae ATCC 10745 = DSM 40063]QEV12855.1 hypothetical protein CP974_13495 [Streptomyces fradiae ATCC 10745 = DSM 40063]UQS31887.1 hypothetical protein J5J01_10040 [Streptomyces fradiae]